ncbi:MAG: hypothetical protein ABH878_04625 [bacterium]
MDCANCREKLVALFDEGLLMRPEGETAQHLESCPACRQEQVTLLNLQEELSLTSLPKPDENFARDFLPRLRQRLDVGGYRWRQGNLGWIPSLGFALLLVLLLMNTPVRIAPPRWFIAQTFSQEEWESYRIVEGTGRGAQFESVPEIDTEKFTRYLGDTEAEFINNLSSSKTYPYTDPLDKLDEMDDQTLNALLEKLKSYPVIRS